ncbi:hypothetical protein [Actinomadura macra]|uniref:hypothetical protein n=1 Tax=Actinomadura macra TaxID=46164 RepID=UPI0012F9F112|nr:hypothetical protein [Actinomadura macra]
MRRARLAFSPPSLKAGPGIQLGNREGPVAREIKFEEEVGMTIKKVLIRSPEVITP